MIICPIDECTGCGACSQVCPVQAIRMVEHAKQWLIPKVDEINCIGCYKCKKVCHINSYIKKPWINLGTYAICDSDKKDRWEASSGGAITIIAKWIFKNGGSVVGAVFDDKLALYEDIVDSYEEYILKGFSKSKYIQSETRDCFQKIQKKLNSSEKLCMFVGTPCQNAALTTYLGREYQNLIKVDFVCHGVPSPGVFRSYRKYLETKYRSRLQKVTFRVKKPSWTLSSTLYEFVNGKKYLGNMMDDPYTACFENNNSLRDCCYKCKYACKERASDITVCDYWGKREAVLTKDDETHGVSVMMLNTDKGKLIFDQIKEKCICFPISYKSVTAVNTRLLKSNLEHPDSEEFWNDYLAGKTWDELKPYCNSYLDTISKKAAFLLKHGNDKPIIVLRKIKKFLGGG